MTEEALRRDLWQTRLLDQYRRSRTTLIALALLLALLGGLFGLAYRSMQHQQDNRTLIAAIKRNDTAAVVALLDRGADPNTRDEPPQRFDLWRLLKDTLTGKRSKPSTALTALLVALEGEGLVEVVPPKRGIFINSSSVFGNGDDPTPGITVSMRYPPENVAMIRALLDHGAQVNVDTSNLMLASSPLECAIDSRKNETALVLIEYGAAVSGNAGQEYVISAINAEMHCSVIKALLDRRPDVYIHDRNGNALLILAVENGRPDVVRLALARHPDVNIHTYQNQTPLSMAIEAMNSVRTEKRWMEIVHMLKAAGARQ